MVAHRTETNETKYNLVTMSVSSVYYNEFRHWLKRHGWLMICYDQCHDCYLFGSIKPPFSGQNITPVFYSQHRSGINFKGYVEYERL